MRRVTLCNALGARREEDGCGCRCTCEVVYVWQRGSVGVKNSFSREFSFRSFDCGGSGF